MATLQEQIDAILRAGKRPSVEFRPGSEILMPKGRRGRPRVRDLDRSFAHYADRRASVRPVRCLAMGCQRRLKARQHGACSEFCADAVFNRAISPVNQHCRLRGHEEVRRRSSSAEGHTRHATLARVAARLSMVASSHCSSPVMSEVSCNFACLMSSGRLKVSQARLETDLLNSAVTNVRFPMR